MIYVVVLTSILRKKGRPNSLSFSTFIDQARTIHLGVVPVGLEVASGTMQITAPLDIFPVPFAIEHPPPEGGAQELPGHVPIGWLAMKLLNSS